LQLRVGQANVAQALQEHTNREEPASIKSLVLDLDCLVHSWLIARMEELRKKKGIEKALELCSYATVASGELIQIL
jgi:hypothetical protein